MLWKVLATVAAGSFIVGGCDLALTEGCESVDFSGSYRTARYACTYGAYPGDLGVTAAVIVMVPGGLAAIALMWLPSILRSRRGH
jgi:hypothetical protein